MPTLPVRRAERRLSLYRARLAAARTKTEKTLLFVIVGWLLGEYWAAGDTRRPDLRNRMIRLAEQMNEEARR